MRYLKICGWEVNYLALCAPDQLELSECSLDSVFYPELRSIGKVGFDSGIESWEMKAVQTVCDSVSPAIVVADYSWLGAIFDVRYFNINPMARKVIFVHDLRVRIMPSLVKMGLIGPEANIWSEALEGPLLAKADMLLTLNNEDFDISKKLAPNALVLKIGMAVSPVYVDMVAAVPQRCIYVAGPAPESVVALLWLLKFVWPLVRAAQPCASLDICGDICAYFRAYLEKSDADLLLNLESLSVSLVGSVENLTPYYQKAEIALIPHWMDGGVKIKHIEAIGHGLAVVCTPAGADGLPEAINYSAYVADLPIPFADNIIRLMSSGTLLENCRRNSRDLSLRLNSQYVYRSLTEYLATI